MTGSALAGAHLAGGRGARGALLVVPLGSTEQHGPHLPLSTDTDVACALAPRRRGARRRRRRARRCRTARAASTPASPARCRSGSEALELLLVELVPLGDRDLRPRVLLLSGARRQRRAAARGAVRLLRAEGARRARVVAVAGSGRRARRAHRDLGAAGALRPPGCAPSAAAPGAHRSRCATLLPELRRARRARRQPERRARRPGRRRRRRGRRACSRRLRADLRDVVAGWSTPLGGSG